MGNRETNVEYMIHTIDNFLKENREMHTKRAKKIAENLLNKVSLSPEQRIRVTSLLITIETRLGKYSEATILGKGLKFQEMSENQRKSIMQKLEYAKRLDDMKKGKIPSDNKEELKTIRDKLYEEKIEASKIKELVDEHAKTARGCIFIAEICKHFAIEEQGVRCLNGYRSKNATTIKENERKAIGQAMELLKQNVIKFPKEKWGEVYAVLDKASALEEPGE